ncbi:TPA: ParB N-terminal domain-containing protein, partial [Pseudomonas aeruginosa]|nr:ParB N-terminal domain-containing protein [Pseudomonas aeruginosa]HCF2671190.1 DUF637 domain-containing protein [Pseudomonas aeruginosa]
ARRDIALSAGRDVTLAAAANEEHAYSKTRKVTYQEDKVAQQGTRVDAGGDLAINAGQDLRLIASQASAGDEAYLVAGDKLELLAANDSNYYLYDKKKKGDFGRKETRRDEVTDVKAVGSQISSGGDLTLLSGGDQTYQGAKLESGNDLAIVSGGAVTFEAVKDLHQESHEKSKGDLAWQSSKGKGQTDETVRQSQIVAQGNLAIKAVEGLKIDLKHIDQKTVSQTIDAMVQADPQLAWLKEAEQRGDVDWRMVQEVHDSWKYSNSGLGAAPSLAIAIVAAAYLGPVYGAMASNLAIGTINNGGDFGKGLKFATSSNALKGYAVAGATAYLVSPQLDEMFGVSTDNVNKVTKGFDLSTMSGLGGFATYSIIQGLSQAGIQTAAFGGSFADNLGDAMAGQATNLAMAAGFNLIGDWADGKFDSGSPQKVMAHALMGGLLAQATGGDFKTGAMAAGANEALVNVLSNMAGGEEKLELMASQLTGLLAATVVDGDVAKGAEIAKNATAYNQQVHRDALSRLKRGMSALHEQGKYADLEPETVLADLQKIASGEAKSVSDLNPKVVQFLNSEFSPASLRETLFEPESWEEYAAIAVDVLYPTPGGKAAAIEKAGGKLSKEALEALEKKFSESTKQELKSKLLQEDPRNLIPTQTKAEMSGAQIKRIVKSIKENGFDQEKPVDVWRNPKTGRLEIQDGHHRTEAAKKAGLDKIPVSIWE